MGALIDSTVDTLLKHERGRRLIEVAGERYVAGHSLEEGLAAAELNWVRHGRKSTIDILGEFSKSEDEAERYLRAYQELRQRIRSLPRAFRENRVISLSLKPSAICVVKNGVICKETPLIRRLGSLVHPCSEDGIDVTLDMEDSALTDETLNAARYMWIAGYRNFGTVLQTRLDRTQHDIRDIFSATYAVPPERMRIRLVLGIYQEPESVATSDNGLAKARLVARARELFDRGAYVEVATHDGETAERVMDEVVVPLNIPSSRVEFQFLKGVPAAFRIERAVREAGYSVRFYMPVEIEKGDGTPYIGRRIKEAGPRMAWYGVKNIAESMMMNGNGHH